MEVQEIISAAIDTFGETNQTVVAIEEMSELQKELCKLMRYGRNRVNIEHIAEEIADVQIMLWELVEMLDVKEMVQQYRNFKLQRLQFKIEKERETL